MNTVKIGIDITVTAGANRHTAMSDLVNSAMQELVNRHDFRYGTIKQGRVVSISVDHEDVRAVVDLTILRIED